MIKPVDDIYMVIDDVVDAVSGTNPKVCHVSYICELQNIFLIFPVEIRAVSLEPAVPGCVASVADSLGRLGSGTPDADACTSC